MTSRQGSGAAIMRASYRAAYLQAVHASLRILDANANRAREALRVLEDAARFALNDAELSAALKGMRHDLRAALESLGADRLRLVASRDTPGDVGTEISTPAEGVRRGLPAVVAAAGARLSEALRVLEETAKTLQAPGADGGSEAAGSLQRLRYRAYELERRAVGAMGTGRARQWRLCVILTEALCRRPWDEVARLAIAGGADCLQLREKTLDARHLVERARRLVDLARPAGASVVVNDRVDVALASGADAVHVGQTDLSVSAVRAIAGERLLVGVSAGTLDQARRAVRDGADYCGLGAMFPTTTKDKPQIAGPRLMAGYLKDEACRAVPHLAIGGITRASVRELTATGCRGVAVSSAACAADDPAAECRAIAEALEE